MKITGTRSYILVEVDGKTVKINGELTTTPAFYADADSITNWEPPFEHVAISENEKKDLIERIIKKTKGTHLEVIFD